MSYVFGYTIANDVSGRDWQKKRNGGQARFYQDNKFHFFKF